MSYEFDNLGAYRGLGPMPDDPSSSLPQTDPLNRWTFWRWGDVLLISVASLAIIVFGFFLSGVVLDLIFGDATPRVAAVPLSILAFVLEFVALVGSMYFLGMRPRGISWGMVGLRPLSAQWGVFSFGLSLLMLPVGALAIYGIANLFGLPMVNSQLPALAPRGLSWASVAVLVLLGGILVPFAEELYFRGVLYTFFRERWGVGIAAVMSSLIFALIHFDLLVAAMAFFLGLFCALAYEYSRSLWASVIIHAVSNTVKLVFIYSMLAQSMKLPWF